MNPVFKTFEAFKQAYPIAGDQVQQENDTAYPNAKFVVAEIDLCDIEYPTINLFFDVGTSDHLLWVWVGGIDWFFDKKSLPTILDDNSFIDEYYEIPLSEVLEYYGKLYEQRIIDNAQTGCCGAYY